MLLRITFALAALALASPSAARAQDGGGQASEAGEGDGADEPRSAADDARARELFALGDRLYAEGRYEGAITAFEEAYRLSGRPLLLFNLANAQERLGDWGGAVESLRAYLEVCDPDERAAVARRIRSIESRLADEAEAGGGEAGGGEEGGATVTPTPEPSNAAGLALVIGGGALAAGGAVLGVVALGQRSDANALCTSVSGRRLCDRRASSALDKDRTFSILADVGVAVGVAAAAVGVYLLVAGGADDEPEPTAVTASATPVRGGGLVSLSGSF